MKNSRIYFMDKIENVKLKGDLFIMAFDGEERSYYGWNKTVEMGGIFNTLLILTYNKELFLQKKDLIKVSSETEQVVLKVPEEQIGFVNELKGHDFIVKASDITIDISCIKIPNFFLLMKYLKLVRLNNMTISMINTVPYDYIFEGEAFVSYKSYLGDLELREIIGFGGVEELVQEEDLYVFLGFEGAMSLKVVEETVYKNLFVVNTLPSYYQKYKDISVVNNYNLLTSKNSKLFYAPAENPFEVYNILDNLIKDEDSVCIAPLCTKPIALGICMYALEHDNVRIVYPVSDKYNDKKSKLVHMAHVYEVELSG